MSKLAGMLGVVTALGLWAAAAAQEKTGAGRTAALVDRLGSKSFAEREQAARELDALGPAALEPLRQAARHESLEVRRRAQGIARKIERCVEAARLLTPARVRLVYKDTPVFDAVSDLRRRTGLTVLLPAGDHNALERRKLTLDTGEVPVWEAFDLFCRKAGLFEVEDRPAPVQLALPRGGVSVRIVGVAGGGFAPEPVDVLGKPERYDPEELKLRDGAFRPSPTHLAGPVRIRRLSPAAAAAARNAGELRLHLDVTTDASLRWHEVVGATVTQAVDDQGQALRGRFNPPPPDPALAAQRGMVVINGRVVTAPEDRPKGPSRVVPLQFEPGPKPSKSLKELSGSLLARVQAPPEILVSIPDVLKAAGKKFTGPQGTWVQVHEARREGSTNVTLRVEVAPPPHDLSDGAGTNEPIMNVIINGKRLGEPEVMLSSRNFELLDARGRPLPANRAVFTGKHTATSQEYELTYPAGDAAPLRFGYRDRRSALIEVPFTLKNVPLE